MYRIAESDCRIGELNLRLTRIAEPDEVLDRVVEEEDRLERATGRRTPEDQLHLPYWAELWDSSVGLGQHLVRHKNELKLLYCLDLGCGMGLAGVVAARIGMRVLFADLESPALLFARLNSLPDASRVRFRRINWATDQLNEQFNVILGSDILYERKQWEHLDHFWRSHLLPNGRILLGEPGRQTGDQFPEWICGRGWKLNEHRESVATREQPIRIFEVTNQ